MSYVVPIVLALLVVPASADAKSKAPSRNEAARQVEHFLLCEYDEQADVTCERPTTRQRVYRFVCTYEVTEDREPEALRPGEVRAFFDAKKATGKRWSCKASAVRLRGHDSRNAFQGGHVMDPLRDAFDSLTFDLGRSLRQFTPDYSGLMSQVSLPDFKLDRGGEMAGMVRFLSGSSIDQLADLVQLTLSCDIERVAETCRTSFAATWPDPAVFSTDFSRFVNGFVDLPTFLTADLQDFSEESSSEPMLGEGSSGPPWQTIFADMRSGEIAVDSSQVHERVPRRAPKRRKVRCDQRRRPRGLS